jgi:hypothetical protein
VVLDVSDCLDTDPFSPDETSSTTPLAQTVRPRFTALTDRLGEHPRALRSTGPYSRLLCLTMFARLVGWTSANVSHPQGVFLCSSHAYEWPHSGLILHYVQAFRNALARGFQTLAGGSRLVSM